ncbi:response regulator transcription factor [Catenuloplanes atrovinosus]|uniref:DNA-binding NarL/FixJ family response regulator n=1 Tax=Catenuloplanes atrovinosus TaxID=137266 RepID=A0AAE3YI37_9ACTN|nr:response regulator transcription factor [Catenuloplanes atrovinosus]MDR7274099.1 DNA-binding NarL/FixJ family response regulator [Catenuloplanes atrovinosus]
MIRVLVVDDNPTVRDALRAHLDASGAALVVGEAGDGRAALDAARRLRPHVTLLDYRMPVADGLSIVAELARLTAVLTLTSDDSDAVVREMLRGGARGYLVHGEFDPAELLRAVTVVASGRSWLSPAAATVAAEALRRAQETAEAAAREAERLDRARRRYGLTAREREVLDLVAEGLANVVIAERLGLTEKTVKNHLHAVFTKLGARNRTEAVLRWTGR